MDIVTIPLDRLKPHPGNSNVMPAGMFNKLVAHLERTDRYPPIIVRSVDQPNTYQILDGHHRAGALKQLGRAEARCVVWEVDDDEALLLVATLNRLQGQDDPHKRAALVAQLSKRLKIESLAKQLPEEAEGLERLLRLHAPPPPPRPPQPLEQVPVPVHFFLLPAQRRQLEQRLKLIGGRREEALMQLIESSEP